MTSHLNLGKNLKLLLCPFSDRCVLPKNPVVCKEGYKECAEYQSFVKKLKP
ncbi:MAG: hypothetical protein BAJALOKI1v1_800003 [Promethearchaeota archaeon]|nr:MAG: hypothetical protein BAJALOKI1v1_800003 [Candidatus Lokiarchaeota archaeon]